MSNIFNYWAFARKEMKCSCKERSAKVKSEFIETGVTPTTLFLKVNGEVIKKVNCCDIADAYQLANRHCTHGCEK